MLPEEVQREINQFLLELEEARNVALGDISLRNKRVDPDLLRYLRTYYRR